MYNTWYFVTNKTAGIRIMQRNDDMFSGWSEQEITDYVMLMSVEPQNPKKMTDEKHKNKEEKVKSVKADTQNDEMIARALFEQLNANSKPSPTPKSSSSEVSQTAKKVETKSEEKTLETVYKILAEDITCIRKKERLDSLLADFPGLKQNQMFNSIYHPIATEAQNEQNKSTNTTQVQQVVTKTNMDTRPSVSILDEKKVDDTANDKIILAVSLDWDGCLGRVKSEDGKYDQAFYQQVVKENEEIIKRIVADAKKTDATEVQLLIGSNRQSLEIDRFNKDKNKNGSCFIGIQAIANEISKRLNIPCAVNPILSPDARYQLAVGVSYALAHEAVKCEESGKNDVDASSHYDCYFDDKKMSLIYLQTHALAVQAKKVFYKFYDDNFEILNTIFNNYNKDEKSWELLAKNVDITLSRYTGTFDPLLDNSPVISSGGPDKHYLKTVNYIQVQANCFLSNFEMNIEYTKDFRKLIAYQAELAKSKTDIHKVINKLIEYLQSRQHCNFNEAEKNIILNDTVLNSLSTLLINEILQDKANESVLNSGSRSPSPLPDEDFEVVGDDDDLKKAIALSMQASNSSSSTSTSSCSTQSSHSANVLSSSNSSSSASSSSSTAVLSNRLSDQQSQNQRLVQLQRSQSTNSLFNQQSQNQRLVQLQRSQSINSLLNQQSQNERLVQQLRSQSTNSLFSQKSQNQKLVQQQQLQLSHRLSGQQNQGQKMVKLQQSHNSAFGRIGRR